MLSKFSFSFFFRLDFYLFKACNPRKNLHFNRVAVEYCWRSQSFSYANIMHSLSGCEFVAHVRCLCFGSYHKLYKGKQCRQNKKKNKRKKQEKKWRNVLANRKIWSKLKWETKLIELTAWISRSFSIHFYLCCFSFSFLAVTEKMSRIFLFCFNFFFRLKHFCCWWASKINAQSFVPWRVNSVCFKCGIKCLVRFCFWI